MKQDFRTHRLEEKFLYNFTTVKVFLTFLESMMTYMTPIFSNTKKLKSSVQNGTCIFVLEKQYL